MGDRAMTHPLREAIGLVIAIGTMLCAAEAGATWPADGLRIDEAENGGALAPDGQGGVIVSWIRNVWIDYGRYGDEVRAQRLSPTGAPLWGTTRPGVAVRPATVDFHISWSCAGIEPDGLGGWLVGIGVTGWSSLSNSGYQIVRIDSSGGISPGWPRDRSVCSVCGKFEFRADSPGGAIVGCELGYESSAYDSIKLTRIAANGDFAWIQYLDLEAEVTQASLALAPSDSGGTYVLWMKRLGRFTSSGELVWSAEIPANSYTGLFLSSDGSGGAYVTWTSRVSYADVPYVLRFDGTGAVAKGWSPGGNRILPASDEAVVRAVAEDGHGGLLVGLTRYNDVRVTRITPSGTTAPGWDPRGLSIGATDYSVYHDPRLVAARGGAYVFWQGDPWSDPVRIYAQHVGADGRLVPGWTPGGVTLCRAPGHRSIHEAVADGAGGAFVSWYDSRATPAAVYVQHVASDDAQTPVMVSVVSASADQDGAHLAWFAQDLDGTAVSVLRRGADSGWQRFGQVAPDGTGMIEYLDRNVSPGNRYGYRLGIVTEGVESFFGEAWVDVPLGPRLRLAVDDADSGEPGVVLELPDAAPAVLRLFDLTGRKLVELEVGSLGPGTHQVRIAERGEFTPGLYWVRLAQAGRSVTARLLVFR